MSKKSSRSKKLEALERAQQINQALETSTIESAALLSSAGESRPTLESHVLDLLDQKYDNSQPPSSAKKGSKKSSKPKRSAKKKRR